MDLGYVTVGAPGGDHVVGDAGARGIEARPGLVWIRCVMGTRTDDESSARGTLAIFAGMACLPRQVAIPRSRQTPSAMETRSTGGRHCHSVLCPLDGSQLRRFSSIYSAAFEPAVRTVAREQ